MFGLINSTLLWALAAVALPLLIHLLTRRKHRVIAISTIAFLKRLERENIRRLKLRQLLLLLLRMLIIALLVLAFARPTLRNNSAALAQRARTTAVVIIDNSLSMAATIEGVSKLSRARRHAQEVAAMLSVGDELYLVTAGRPASLVPGSPFLEFEEIDEVVATIPQTWAETDLAGALTLAREILDKSHNLNRELYVLSDCRDSSLPLVQPLSGVRGYVVRYAAPMTNNLTLANTVLANQIFERGKSFEVVSTVANNGESDLSNHLIHLFLNNKRSAQQSLEVPAGSQRSVTFRAIPDSSGFVTGRVTLEDDDLLLDNSRYFTFYIPPQRRLLAAGETAADLTYLRAALQNGNPNRRESWSRNQWKEVTASQLPAERFEDYDCILLANLTRFPEGVAPRLISFLNNGGGVIIFLGSEVDLRYYNEALLSRINLGAFGETMGSLARADNFIKLGKIDFSHPLFDGVFEPGDGDPKVDSPRFRFAVQLRLAEGTVPIMNYANSYPFLVERHVGSGRLLLFTTSADEKWSDFSFKGLFAPLVHRSVTYVAQRLDHLQKPTVVGDELVTNLRQQADELVVESPGAEYLKVPVEVVGQSYQVRVRDTDEPGFYQLREGNRLVHVWPVNFNAAEMSVEPADEQTLAAASGASSLVTLSATGELRAEIEAARYGSELWRLFLIAALLAMIVEMLLYRSSARDSSPSNGSPAGSPASSAQTTAVAG